MRRLILAILMLVPAAAAAQPARYAGDRDQVSMVVMRAATQPQPFLGADGNMHLVYEVEVTSARPQTVLIDSFEVLDTETSRVLWSARDAMVKEWFQLLDHTVTDTLLGSQTGEFWLDVKLKPGEVPRRLAHRITTTSKEKGLTVANPVGDKLEHNTVTGAPVEVSQKPVLVLGPPLEGKGWIAMNSCCTGGHRRAGIPVNGAYYVSQALAIDYMQLGRDDYLVAGDPDKNEDYVCYGRNVLAVADGTVASVLDGLPDRVPGKLPPDTTIQNVTGNHVILDIGNGRYVFYAHLKSGTIKVKVGERVKRGQVLALLGNSGNTSAPHLHIHVMDALSPLGANNVPYVVDWFTITGAIDNFEPDPNQHPMGQKIPIKRTGASARVDAFPMDGDIVDF